MKDPDYSVRRTAAEDPHVVESLIAALRNADSGVRMSAAETLLESKDPRVVEPLIAALKDPDSAVRMSAAETLGSVGIKDLRAVEPLITVLKDPDFGVRQTAIDALRGIKDSRAVEPLAAALKADPDGTGRGSATTLVMNYLAAASTLELSAAMAFVSRSCKSTVITEFQANERSGWRVSGADTEIVSETILPQDRTATVVALVIFKGGSPPTFMTKSQTFFLVREKGAWKISRLDPAPTSAGPGVRPLTK